MIGIILRKNHSSYVLNEQISNLLKKYNFDIALIDPSNINYEIVKKCKGFILQGGNYFFNDELNILKYLYDNDIPTLGICLGMQEMGLFFEGKLKRVKSHNKKAKYVHFVYLDKDSYIYHIIKKSRILVNSRHSYVLSKTKLNISGISNDRQIEIIEAKNKKFFIGFQFHPESIIDDIVSIRIFDYFFKICK